MNTTVRRAAAIVLPMLLAACGSSAPTSPTATSLARFQGAQPPPANFPPLSGPSRTFVFERELSNYVNDYTRHSRFVLYDNGAFELQYPPSQYGPGLYGGEYQNADGVIGFLFEFEGRSVGAAFNDATGTLKGDSLTVQYDWNMRMADFEDGVYVQMP